MTKTTVPGLHKLRLDQLSSQQWQTLCPSLANIMLPDRAVIYRQGDLCRHVYLVVKGYVKLSRLNQDGCEFTIAILNAGEAFGIVAGYSAAADNKCPDTTLTKGATRICKIPHAEFQALLDMHPAIAWSLVEMLTRRQRLLEDRLEHLLYQDVEARVIHTLHSLTSQYGGPCNHGHIIDIRLTQQELAEMAGASRPVVSTVLNDLRNRDLISYTRSFICIHKPALLSMD